MRLWSIHPKYLDPRGLVALWREALLAQAVIAGKTRGYRQHPQLTRFLASSAPKRYIAEYLKAVRGEAVRRGYRFDARKIGRGGRVRRLIVTNGQLEYEWQHLLEKVRRRAPIWYARLRTVRRPAPHPLFRVVNGDTADWEVGRKRR